MSYNYFSYVGKFLSNVKGFYKEINAATLTGAIDVIIVQQEDGTYLSSPFHVRFGKLGVLRSREKIVDIEINGQPVHFQMKLGESGEAFFVKEVEEENEDIPLYLATSPLNADLDLMERGVQELKMQVQETIKEKSPDHERKDSDTSDRSCQSQGSRGETQLRVENELSGKVKRRRKRKNVKRQTPTKTEGHVVGSEAIFEMDDSTDEEMVMLTSGMEKPTTLPVMMEENKLERTSVWASAHEEKFKYANPHPFSDTDLSPIGSPSNTRPSTPKSDTELDRTSSHHDLAVSILEGEDNTLWEWGSLPRKSATTTNQAVTAVKEDETNKTGTKDNPASKGGLFHFMRQTKNVRHRPEKEGIYLDDLNLEEMDPEVAKLYFPKRLSKTQFHSIKEKDEEDSESGRGASLPQSPHSVEGAIGGPPTTYLKSEVLHLGMFALSLCGGLADSEGVTLEKFMQKIVTYEDLCENSNMFNNPDLVVRVSDKYYNWNTAAPMILCQSVFHKDLPGSVISSLATQHMPKKKEKKTGGVSSWFPWRRNTTDEPTPVTTGGTSIIVTSTSDSEVSSLKTTETGPKLTPASTGTSSLPGSPQKLKPENRLKEDVSSSEADTDGSEYNGSKTAAKPVNIPKKKKDKFKKSLRLTSDEIAKLGLIPGQNEIKYSVTTQYQGTTACTSHIYLWNYDNKIIVSDIDGTITKSDVLGQILPIVGRDWSQSGVAQLYTRIHKNGYKFLYLSARAIGQSKITKDLLQNIKQGDLMLPEGPLLLSPTSLISAFHREVIEKKPEDFKIGCLKDIAALFPNYINPFYAGFGNKINDVYAYKAINIPIYRIFTINHKGELKHEQSHTFQTSYSKLSNIADHFFPPIHSLATMEGSYFNEVQFWRDPLPQISLDEISTVLNPITAASSIPSTSES
ncbi:hypothetical protein CHS0354_000926 [Potamilus streckersoni]|uniref:phosphatidate phosphatase n=1 Tax=Potamilus streckersoni TaxID=2493646 RepID=A0AAE0W8Q0_9BIVA|nr:hypothetical protein CHS0354_000926 [Potamilus streckersoni]